MFYNTQQLLGLALLDGIARQGCNLAITMSCTRVRYRPLLLGVMSDTGIFLSWGTPSLLKAICISGLSGGNHESQNRNL